MAFYISKRKLRPRDKDELGELNIVPYLDIMVNLIMFMLVTFQVLVELRTISFNPPGSGPAGPVKAFLTVLVEQDRYLVLRNGASVRDLPNTPSGYDTVGLTGALVDENHGVDPNLVVAATPDVPYGAIVQTLDAARTSGDGTPLFPQIVLGAPR